MEKKTYQLIIIGAGPAGLSAAIYAQRAQIDTLVLEKLAPGGQILTSDKIENYPGFPKPIPTQQLISRIIQQAKNLGMQLRNEGVEKIKEKDEKIVYTDSGNTYKSSALIIATGANPLTLGIPGEKEFTGKGVSYCATCDAPFFRDQKVVVVGGGNTAAEEAIYLTKFAEKVYLVHRRDKLRADKILQKRLLNNKKIEVIWDTVPERIYGNNQVKGVILKNVKSNETKEKECAGVFIFVGVKPNTDFVKGWIDVDERGFILTNEKMETSREGVFACGDVRSNLMKQVVVACSEGAQAAFMAGKYLEWKEGQ